MQVGEPPLEGSVDGAPLVAKEDRLPDAQAQVLVFAEVRPLLGRTREDPGHLLEDAVRLPQLEGTALPLEPGREVPPVRLSPRRDLDGLDELRKRKEVHLLGVVGVTVGVVERPCALDQEGGPGEVESVAGQRLSFSRVRAVLPEPAEPMTMRGSGEPNTAAWASSNESGLSRTWSTVEAGLT